MVIMIENENDNDWKYNDNGWKWCLKMVILIENCNKGG